MPMKCDERIRIGIVDGVVGEGLGGCGAVDGVLPRLGLRVVGVKRELEIVGRAVRKLGAMLPDIEAAMRLLASPGQPLLDSTAPLGRRSVV